jgi:hypothetical protein
LLIIPTTTKAIEPRWLNWIEAEESNHRPGAIGDNGKAIGLFQFHEAAWIHTSEIRRKKGKPTYPYVYAYNQSINKAYAVDWLEWHEEQLTKRLGRSPNIGELFASHNLGLQGFANKAYLLDRTRTSTRTVAYRLILKDKLSK